MMRMSHSSDLCYVTERSEAPGLNLCYVTDRSFDPIYLWPSISPSAARTSRSISATSCAPKCGSRSQNARPFRLDLGGWDKLAARAGVPQGDMVGLLAHQQSTLGALHARPHRQ
jgi:hypothetical protein